MKIKKSQLGHWCKVKWNDVGTRDCLLVEIDPLTVFEPFNGTIKVDDSKQIKSIGKYALNQDW